MDTGFVWLVIGPFAAINSLGVMKKQNQLTVTRFALIVTAYWSYFSLSAFHFSHDALTSKGIFWLGTGSLLLWWTVGYQFARWIYRQVFPEQ